MPDLSSSIHTDMLKRAQSSASLPKRLYRAVRRELRGKPAYGLQWGDPDTVTPLMFIRDRWVLPYVDPEKTALEIGPGGGRWTRYLLEFRKLYVVDYHQELLDELRKNFDRPNMVPVRNSGTDFPGVPDRSIDFVFSFGTFVHLDEPLIKAYLTNILRILAPGGNAVLQYADATKVMAAENPDFADTTPEDMRRMTAAAGFRILEEDTTTMWNSSLIRLTK